jgi:adenylate cyclase
MNLRPNLAFTPPAVRAQLAAILASEAFVRSRRMQRFLEFVVEETLAGRDGQLGEYGIGLAVFDRSPDFEPALDPIVRNDARRLRAKLAEYYRQRASHTSVVVAIEIPKGGYVPVFLPCRPVSPPAEPNRRITVLPFEDLSASADGTRYALGLCTSLSSGLANLDGLETVAYGFFRQLAATPESGLTHVIAGTLLQSGPRCRVLISLIRLANGTQLWAREYDFDAGDMLAFCSEITRAVLHGVTTCLGLPHPQLTCLAIAA